MGGYVLSKIYIEKIEGCIGCPYYSNVNGTMKTARCGRLDGPDRLLTKDEVWEDVFPDECPLEDYE